jgi:hypothetical protein
MKGREKEGSEIRTVRRINKMPNKSSKEGISRTWCPPVAVERVRGTPCELPGEL